MKKARFKVGSSGSPKHTETRHSGRKLQASRGGSDAGLPGTRGGDQGAYRAPPGPRVGPGVLGTRVKSEVGRDVTTEDGSGASRSAPRGLKTYAEE